MSVRRGSSGEHVESLVLVLNSSLLMVHCADTDICVKLLFLVIRAAKFGDVKYYFSYCSTCNF